MCIQLREKNIADFFSEYGDQCSIVNGIFCDAMSHQKAKINSFASYNQSKEIYSDYLHYYARQVSIEKPFPYVVIDTAYKYAQENQGFLS